MTDYNTWKKINKEVSIDVLIDDINIVIYLPVTVKLQLRSHLESIQSCRVSIQHINQEKKDLECNKIVLESAISVFQRNLRSNLMKVAPYELK